MTETHHYDAVVIGSGQGGNPLATSLAKAGHKVAIVERQHMGGTCINYGCTPTKTMVASAKVAYMTRAVLGIEGGEIAAMIQIAMLGKVPYTALRDAVFTHPTLAESLNNLFSAIE